MVKECLITGTVCKHQEITFPQFSYFVLLLLLLFVSAPGTQEIICQTNCWTQAKAAAWCWSFIIFQALLTHLAQVSQCEGQVIRCKSKNPLFATVRIRSVTWGRTPLVMKFQETVEVELNNKSKTRPIGSILLVKERKKSRVTGNCKPLCSCWVRCFKEQELFT